MLTRRFRSTLAALIIVAAFAPTTRAQDGPVETALKLLPADPAVAVVVPHLKYFSDELTRCLEGMDRGSAIMGRPIDQIKSMTGYNAAINDLGGGAIALVPRGESELIPAVLLPILDEQAFLAGNYAGQDGDAWLRTDGTKEYVKFIDGHALLTRDAELAATYAPAGEAAIAMAEALGRRGREMLAEHDAFVLLTPRGAAWLRQAVATELNDEAPPHVAAAAKNLLADFEFGALMLDLDPLAVAVRSMMLFKTEIAQGQPSAAGLARLPNKPYYVAASIDLASIGGREAVELVADKLGMPGTPQWLTSADAIQFAAYPSPAGIAGGLLNDAVAVLSTRDPAQMHDAIRENILDLQNLADGITRQVRWNAGRQVEQVGTADAYEVKMIDVPPHLAQLQLVEQIVFGRMGWRGFVQATSDAIIVTFSQRPAVLKAAVDAASAPAEADGSGGLGATSAIKAMRAWMPPQRDVEAYINLGRITHMMRQVAQGFGLDRAIVLPEIDPELPPVGFAADCEARSIETATIIPAGVAAAFFDYMISGAGRGVEADLEDASR